MLYQIIEAGKSYGTQAVFCGLSFEMKDREKIAVVGKNGTGKTTLLRIIAGREELDTGEISKDKKSCIGYLEQIVFQDEDITIREELEQCFEQIHCYGKKMNELELLMQTDSSQDILNRYGKALSLYEEAGGYRYETELRTVFTKFGFPVADLEKKIREFSGGQRTRIAFVKLLLSKPDVLLLDEPTNHLDMETIEWLEGYIKNYPGAAVIVSHDRLFLDHTVDLVYEIEDKRAYRYVGNYSGFVKQKSLDIQRQNKERENQQKEIRRLEELIEKFRYKVNKAKFAQAKIKYLERMEIIEERKEDTSAIRVRFSSRLKGGDKVLTVKDLGVGYQQVLCRADFCIRHGGRIAVIGRNGTGKSTLVKTLVGKINPLEGGYTYGREIETGYFDQELAQFDSDRTVLEELWGSFPDMGQTEIRNALGSFRFQGEEVFKSLNVLSGGEKVRLALAKLMLRHDNFLVLDEPTNHLDVYGKEALEKALKEFDGSVLFVSHDRYFVSTVATAVLEIGDRGAVFYDMPYQEYLAASRPTAAGP